MVHEQMKRFIVEIPYSQEVIRNALAAGRAYRVCPPSRRDSQRPDTSAILPCARPHRQDSISGFPVGVAAAPARYSPKETIESRSSLDFAEDFLGGHRGAVARSVLVCRLSRRSGTVPRSR